MATPKKKARAPVAFNIILARVWFICLMTMAVVIIFTKVFVFDWSWLGELFFAN